MACGDRISYTDSQYGFGYCHPTTWMRYVHGGVVGFEAPMEDSADGFPENINVVTEFLPAGTTLAQYVNATLAQLPGLGLTPAAQGPFNGALQPGWRIEYTGSRGGRFLHNDATVFVHADLGYVMTFSAEEGHRDSARPDAEAAAASMRFV